MMRDIYSFESLKKLDEEFKGVYNRHPRAPTRGSTNNEMDHRVKLDDDDIIQKSILLEQYFTQIFPIQNELSEFYSQAELWDILSEFKLQFVQRRALRKYSKHDVDSFVLDKKFASLSIHKLALQVLDMLKNEEQYQDELDKAMRYVAWKAYREPDHSIFILPKKLDFENLVSHDNKHVPKTPMAEAHYCIYCHNQEKDHCRTGMEGKVNALGNGLTGCPLRQKISEMNYLYAKGNIIAALAVTMIDNPLVAATGNRVCNDCMKSCIYQKQEPVDIPCVESDMLKDVLSLPYGAEIYYLLTRWNPLANYIAKENSPGKALVAGMGPAGFAMSYYLLREGHQVVGVDGMKISKLDEKFFKPIHNWKEAIGEYEPQGFGGVSEYGITDRWDKSNLLLIRMILERFANFELKDKTRLGRDISLMEAGKNHDYIALCLGAGAPILPKVKNIDAKGVFSAFKFLMDVNVNRHPRAQTRGSTNNKMDHRVKLDDDGVNNTDLLSPVIVLGAGLTAIDCATASVAENADVTILYRKSMRDSPSYRENHEELQIALDQGIKFIENTNLETIELDDEGRIKSVNGNIPARSLVFAFGTGNNDKILLNNPDAAMFYKDKIGIFGDLDPKYSGSVVKAIASSKDAHERVISSLRMSCH